MSDQPSTANDPLSSDVYASLPTNKRKREDSEQDDVSRSQNTSGDSSSDNISQQLLQAMHANGVQEDDSARTAQAALASSMPGSTYPPPDTPFDHSAHSLPAFGDDPSTTSLIGSTAHALYVARGATNHANNAGKPPVGTDAWHQLRKDNHKEGM